MTYRVLSHTFFLFQPFSNQNNLIIFKISIIINLSYSICYSFWREIKAQTKYRIDNIQHSYLPRKLFIKIINIFVTTLLI